MASGDSVTRRQFLKTSAAFLAVAAIGRPLFAAPSRPPNIVVIVADDLGYGDVGCFGCPDIPTPQIDALASAGTRFVQGYVGSPICSPSRACLLTGRLPARIHWECNPAEAALDIGLPEREVTVANCLLQRGYATGCIGKWHLGRGGPFLPRRRGFEYFYGFFGAERAYVQRRSLAEQLYRNEEPVADPGTYLTDAFAGEAVDFIRQNADRPFFLYFAPNAVHGPFEAPQAYLSRAATRANPNRWIYAAMAIALDDAVGRVLAEVNRQGLAEGTLVFFVSDNGPNLQYEPPHGSPGPFKGGKGCLYEGGIRVPFVATWPGTIPAGTTYDAAVITADILPTILDATHSHSAARLDGASLLRPLPDRRLVWRITGLDSEGRGEALREGKWKFIARFHRPPELYDVEADPAESTNLASRESGRASAMANALAAQWLAMGAAPTAR